MLIIKGIIIGIGKIIPGVSGSMLAISMGIYEKLINSINDFFKDKKNNFKFLFKISIGIIISILFFSKIILRCLDKYYLVTMFLFIGLIIGSLDLPNIKEAKKNKIVIFISFLLVTIIGINNLNSNININNSILDFLFYIVVGFIDAITMVIPGISGTATLMMLGIYDNLIYSLSNIMDINLTLDNIKILFPFFIGLIIGIIITVKIVNYLFKKYKDKTYSAIIGFSLSTIVLMFVKCINTNYTLIMLILAFIALLVGLLVSKKINHCI